MSRHTPNRKKTVRLSAKNAIPMRRKAAENASPALIRFPHGLFAALRRAMLADLSHEHFGMLLARRETAPNGREIFVVVDVVLADQSDCVSSGLCHVRPSKEFVGRVLALAQADMKVNAVIDVHTHPFSSDAHFSGIDDADEQRFSRWLYDVDDRIGYASLLLSAEAWEARVWHNGEEQAASVKTQTLPEHVPHVSPLAQETDTPAMQARTALALGVDVIRRIAENQRIVLAGVGGLGSVLAEQLVRSGFTRLGLIDADILELSNLNRFAGGFRDSIGKPKVSVVQEHVLRINPEADVSTVCAGVETDEAQSLLAGADWIIVSTDSHSSRQCVQNTALRYGVPLLSAGVSITVEQSEGRHHIVDQSGEVIVLRYGDGYCLHCLGRINPYKVAAETNPDATVRSGLVTKGYVQGMQEKEPAVMPLNAVIASIATQTLLDQYRDNATHHPIVVYESHAGSCCYPDRESLEALPALCPACGRNVAAEQTMGWNQSL